MVLAQDTCDVTGGAVGVVGVGKGDASLPLQTVQSFLISLIGPIMMGDGKCQLSPWGLVVQERPLVRLNDQGFIAVDKPPAHIGH